MMQITLANLLIILLAMMATEIPLAAARRMTGCGGYENGPPYLEKPCDDNVTSRPTSSPAPTGKKQPKLSPTSFGFFEDDDEKVYQEILSLDYTEAPTIVRSPFTDSPTKAPTTSPAPTDSTAPSRTPSPTKTPSPTRTPAPSKSSAPSSSPEPTFTPAPTDSPAPSRTPSPTKTPSPTRTPAPTFTPAPTVTATPTVTPAPTFTAAPTDACVTDPTGSFGVIGDDPLDSVTEVPVEFAYELESTGFRNTKDIIDDLERLFNNAILPILFADECGDASDTSLLDVVGVSTKLEDTIYDGVTCDNTTMVDATSNECVVVKGSLTIFVDGSAPLVKDDVLDRLEERMGNGFFVDPTLDIVRVSFVDIDSIGGVVTPIDNTPGSESGNGGNDLRVLYAVVAGVCTLLLALLAFVWSKRKQKEANELGANDGSTLETPAALEPSSTV